MLEQELKSESRQITTSDELNRVFDFENEAGGVDKEDMYRMGKEQQFRVRRAPDINWKLTGRMPTNYLYSVSSVSQT
jgi:hypothetical protein